MYSQVHGIAWDTIQFVEGIITTEMNSATDNPVSDYCTILTAGRDVTLDGMKIK